jgi:PleD family two-component response regulator
VKCQSSKKPPAAWVIAVTDCKVFPIDENRLFTLIDFAPPLARNLLSQVIAWVRTNKHQVLHARLRIEELANHANLDELTGLYNRRWLEQALPRLLTSNAAISLLIFDVDHFKAYNDAHGHPGGDRALIAS